MIRLIRSGLITWCILMGYGGVSMVQAQPTPADKAVAEARMKKQSYISYSLEQLRQMEPTSPNPYLSLLPSGVKPDWGYWQARMRAEAIARRASQPQEMGATTTIDESEPNDSQETGNPITDFGNDPGKNPAIDVMGSFPEPPAPTPVGPFGEDDGAIPLANDTGLTTGQRVTVMAQLGDGPHGFTGTGSGDFDFYAISGVTAGQLVTAVISTPDSGFLGLDSFLAAWDSSGNLVAFNDDDPSRLGFDSFVLFTAPAAGIYYISVGSFGSPVPRDPSDSSSGIGAFTEGEYELILGLGADDIDFFTVTFDAGDVLNVNGLGASSHVSLFDPAGVERITSNLDVTPVLPESAPFAAGDNPSFVYVIEEAGIYAVRVTGRQSGIYLVELRTARPPLEVSDSGTKQVLFIDFDGAIVDTSIFEAFVFGRRLLSPLRLFLPKWGLTPTDEDAVIDVILAVVKENLQTDILAVGNNSRFDIEIRNSRDHDDPFGQPNVSRVIVGGTIDESKISTIGIAESIDVGNFNTTETALVLLDTLSGTNAEAASVNTFDIDPSASIVDFIGIAVGNIVAHEAGHFFGNFHTDQFNALATIMDQGGNPAGTFGVGADNIFGTADDVDVDFDVDDYVLNEGLVGIEDTLNVISFGLSSSSNSTAATNASVSAASQKAK